jgi:hypothetical protein
MNEEKHIGMCVWEGGLSIWWNLKGWRGPLRKSEPLNPTPWPPAGLCRAYASALSRYLGGSSGSASWGKSNEIGPDDREYITGLSFR